MRSIYLSAIAAVFVFFHFSTYAQISGDTAVCAGETLTYGLTPTPGATYFWSASGGTILGTPSADTVLVQWGAAGNGTLTLSQSNPNATLVLNVIIHPNPNPVITHPLYPTCPSDTAGGSSNGQSDNRDDCERVCKGATVTYSTTLNPGSTYVWGATGQWALITSGNTATVTWDSSGYGRVWVIETNSWGCVDSAELCVKKVNLPVAAFSHQSSACRFSPVAFTNLSTGATSFQWYFGDGGSSTQANPSHSYANAGTYTITLIAINACYCRDTFTSQLSIDSLAGPEISCPSTVCAFDTASYSTSFSSGCIYNWFTIGGTIVSGQGSPSVTVAWGAGQLGTLGLYISGCNTQCPDTTFIQIPIIPAVGSIQGDPVVCPGDCKTYSLPLFSGTTYTWSLGSGGCGVLSDSVCCNEVEICWSSLLFGCNDTLTVQFYDSFLQCGGSASMVIRLRPQMGIFGPNPTCSNSISTYQSTLGNACFWSLAPSGPVYAPGPSNSTTVNWAGQSGNFQITAIPVNPNSTCTDSAIYPVQVVASPAAPVISGDTIVCAGASVSYCVAPSANTVHWQITGGTPSSATGSCVSVTWGNSPPYQVRAYHELPNSPFCTSDTTLQNVYTASTAPPVIAGSSPFCANASSLFSCTNAYPPGTNYYWRLNPANAGGVLSPLASSTTIQWGNNAPQSVWVVLEATVCGTILADSFLVSLNPAPVPAVVQLGNLCPGGTAQLQASGGISYQWSGPGAYASVVNPTSISQSGLYQVTVADVNGCTALSQKTVTAVSGPIASISTLSGLVHCIGSTYSVTMCALGNVNYGYQWSNLAVTPCITVNSPGSYSVVVTDLSNNCTALSNVLVVQEDSCNGGGSGGGAVCIPNGTLSFTQTACNPVAFTNTSVNAFGFNWNFGDFSSSLATNPTHSYPQAGFYVVTLSGLVPSVSGTDTCIVQDTAHIEIPLLARFDVVTGCWNDPVCFTDLSTYTAGNTITGWNWNFGDANTSTLQNPCHTYATPGTYIVSLTVSNGICTEVITDTIVVSVQPTAAFTFVSPNCIQNPVLFTDGSFSGINYWSWNFGDAGTSLNQNPTHSYAAAGLFPVTLIVRDTAGCADTVQQNIMIVTPSLSGNIIAFPDTIVCAGTPVLLVAPPCGSCTWQWSNGSTNDSVWVSATGNYSVTLNDGSGCPYATSIGILVHTPPYAVIAASDNEICVGGFVSMTVPASTNWLYQWISNDANVNGSVVNSVFAFGLPVGTYTYEVVITDTSTGCSDTTLPFVLTIHPLPVPPVIIALGSTTICAGDTTYLLGSHPDPTVSLQWNTGSVNDTLIVTQNGCYYLTATDTNGCESTASFCVTVNPLPDLCSFYEGCLDTCLPYTICAPAGVSWQWLNNGVPIAGATAQCYAAAAGGQYAVIVTNAFGCVDTTGTLNLSPELCPDSSLCGDLQIDSIVCKPTGQPVIYYQILNLTNTVITQVTFEALPPHLNLAYAPFLNPVNILPGGNSGTLMATLYNSNPGDTVCFRSHLAAFDSLGNEILCCYTDTECVIIPPCSHDSVCCSFNYLQDTVICNETPTGTTYTFQIQASGCGTLTMQPGNGTTINGNNPLQLTGSPVTISGTHIPSNPADTLICILFTMSNNNVACWDSTICISAGCSSHQGPPPCNIQFTDSICAGQSTTFSYGGNPAGLTFTWQLSGGTPSLVYGPGPHTITYPTAGCYPFILIINDNLPQTVDCSDSICVLPPPVASIQQVGNTLFAFPGGYSYQWYSVNPNWTLMPGEVNQFLNPVFTAQFCVVVSAGPGCADTACIDHDPVGVEEQEDVNWSLYPNPNTGAFVLQVTAKEQEEIMFSILDGLGKQIDWRVLTAQAGENQFYISNERLAAGVYQVQLKTSRTQVVRRMMVR